MKLTGSMLETLRSSSKQELRRVHDDTPGAPPWPAPWQTLQALTRHGLIEHSRIRNRKGWPVDVWRITDAGREALTPPIKVKRDSPRYLAAAGSIRYKVMPDGRWAVDESHQGYDDYTSDPRRSIDTDKAPNGRRAAVEVLVTEADLKRFSEDATRNHRKRVKARGRELDTFSFDRRVQNAEEKAYTLRVSVGSEVRLISHLRDSGRPEAADKRLAHLEVRLNQRHAA